MEKWPRSICSILKYFMVFIILNKYLYCHNHVKSRSKEIWNSGNSHRIKINLKIKKSHIYIQTIIICLNCWKVFWKTAHCASQFVYLLPQLLSSSPCYFRCDTLYPYFSTLPIYYPECFLSFNWQFHSGKDENILKWIFSRTKGILDAHP